LLNDAPGPAESGLRQSGCDGDGVLSTRCGRTPCPRTPRSVRA